MSQSINRRMATRWLAAAIIIGMMGCGLLALLVKAGLNPNWLLAERLERELATVPEVQVESHLEKIAGLGQAGTAVLVRVLSHKRPIVAATARAVIRRQLQRWQMLTARRSSTEIALLARHLANHTDSFDLLTRRFAADLATQMLLWPMEGKAIDNQQFIADCERLLLGPKIPRSATVAARSPVVTFQLTDDSPTDHVHEPAQSGVAAATTDESSAPETDEFPSEVVEVFTPTSTSENRSRNPIPNATNIISDPTLPTGEGPLPFSPSTGRRLSPNESSVHDATDSDVKDGPHVDSESMEHGEWPTNPQLEPLDYRDVMRYLRAPDSATVLAASEELMRRGFNADDLLLAERLMDPDPRVRRQLATLLPRMSGVDARQWLLWLARDEDTTVRQEAMSILATSRDPQVQQQIREIAERNSFLRLPTQRR